MRANSVSCGAAPGHVRVCNVYVRAWPHSRVRDGTRETRHVAIQAPRATHIISSRLACGVPPACSHASRVLWSAFGRTSGRGCPGPDWLCVSLRGLSPSVGVIGGNGGMVVCAMRLLVGVYIWRTVLGK